MNEETDIDIQIHRLSARLWVSQNYDYQLIMNRLRARIKYRKVAVPKLELKIIQYEKELELDIGELKAVQRGRNKQNKTGWSSLCKTGHHKICKGKNNTCKCQCHYDKS